MGREASLFLLILALLILLTNSNLASAQVWDVRIEAVSFTSSANTPVYPGSKNAELRVEVKFFTNATRPVGELSALPPGFSPSYGYGLSVGARDAYGADAVKVREGETVHFVYRINVDKTVKPGNYLLNFQLSFTDDSGQPRMYYMWFEVTVSDYPALNISIVDARWSPVGYNGTYGASLIVTFENDGNTTVYYGLAKLACPEPFICRDNEASFTGLQPGQRVTLTFSPIDIPENVAPGNYGFSITINSSMMTDDGVTYSANATLQFTMSVTEPPTWIRQIEVAQAIWGSLSPQPAYQDSLYAQLSITFRNKGPYTISSLYATLSSSSAEILTPAASSTAPMGVGGSTSLSFYANINASSVLTNNVSFTVKTRYTLELGSGAYLVLVDEAVVAPRLEPYPKGNSSGVGIVTSAWQNNYAVYPNTSNAVLTLQVSNNLPFTLAGVNITMILPEGFSFDGKKSWTYYIANPLQPYGSAQASFSIDVGNVEPGRYKALVIIDYVAQTGGPGKRMVDYGEVNLTVTGMSSPVEVVNTRWAEGSPDVHAYGASLLITLRNIEVDSMSSPVLIVELPDGIRFSYTNTSVAAVIPGTPQPAIPPQAITSPQELIQYITSLQQQQSQSTRVAIGKGETITFTLPLNLMLNQTGVYVARAKLSFIDQWGSLREASLEIPIVVLGSSRYIDVSIEGSMSVKSRYNNATLIVKNVGSSSIYNVYITITPPSAPLGGQQATILIVTPSTYYVDYIGPGEELRIPLTLVFNPLVSQSMYGVSTMMSYGVVPLDVSISYRDPSGSSKSFRNQIALAVEPFIDIVLSDVKAQLQGGLLKISGTIINYGSSTAYRLSVQALVGNQTASFYVGDVDPGSTNAFRIDQQVPPGLRPSVVTLKVTYYNAFNEKLSREVEVSVVEVSAPAPTTTPKPETIVSKIGINALIALIGIFVLVAGILIFRLYKSHMKRLESASPQ